MCASDIVLAAGNLDRNILSGATSSTVSGDMACAFFAHSEGLPEAGALDLSRKPTECGAHCQCLTCIFNRFNVPIGARNMLLQQWPKQHQRHVSSPDFNYDHNANQFKLNGKEDIKRETLKTSESSPIKVRGTTALIPGSNLRQNTEGYAHHYNEYTSKSPHSTTSSNRSSPVNGCFRSPAFPGSHPDAYTHEPFNPTPFNSQHFPMGMMSPTQLSLNAWWTLNPPKTSPTTITTKSSPERPTSVEGPCDVMRSNSSSPGTRSLSCSLSSPDPHRPEPSKQTTVTPSDKDTVYMQKRLKNNLAAKRSRDLRRQREDRIAADCRRMHHVLKRVKLVRSGYLRFLVANNLGGSHNTVYRV